MIYIPFIINIINSCNQIPSNINNYIENYNEYSNINIPDETGKTPLIRASINGDIAVVKYLLNPYYEAQEVNINKQDGTWKTALMYSSLNASDSQ